MDVFNICKAQQYYVSTEYFTNDAWKSGHKEQPGKIRVKQEESKNQLQLSQ